MALTPYSLCGDLTSWDIELVEHWRAGFAGGRAAALQLVNRPITDYTPGDAMSAAWHEIDAQLGRRGWRDAQVTFRPYLRARRGEWQWVPNEPSAASVTDRRRAMYVLEGCAAGWLGVDRRPL